MYVYVCICQYGLIPLLLKLQLYVLQKSFCLFNMTNEELIYLKCAVNLYILSNSHILF